MSESTPEYRAAVRRRYNVAATQWIRYGSGDDDERTILEQARGNILRGSHESAEMWLDTLDALKAHRRNERRPAEAERRRNSVAVAVKALDELVTKPDTRKGKKAMSTQSDRDRLRQEVSRAERSAEGYREALQGLGRGASPHEAAWLDRQEERARAARRALALVEEQIERETPRLHQVADGVEYL